MLAIVGESAVVFSKTGRPSVLAVKLCEMVTPFSGETAVDIPGPFSRLRMLLIEPSTSRTGVPVTEPSWTMLPVTPRVAYEIAVGDLVVSTIDHVVQV